MGEEAERKKGDGGGCSNGGEREVEAEGSGEKVAAPLHRSPNGSPWRQSNRSNMRCSGRGMQWQRLLGRTGRREGTEGAAGWGQDVLLGEERQGPSPMRRGTSIPIAITNRGAASSPGMEAWVQTNVCLLTLGQMVP